MKDLSSISAPTRADYHQKIAKFYRLMHERSAKTIMGLTGAAVVLPLAAEAQVSPARVSIDEVSSIREYTLQTDGSVRAVLQNGQKVLITENNVIIAADGSLLISELAAEELLLASDSAYGMVGVSTGEGIAAAAGGVLGLSSLLGSDSLAAAITKIITVVDAPIQGAAVFYDTNGNDSPDASEYLGLTDENGAVSITYTPVEGASIIILPLPVSGDDFTTLFGSGAAANALEASIVDDFNNADDDATNDITTIQEIESEDVITGNAFDLFLTAKDDADLDNQVVSPLSTLVDQGIDEDVLKEFLGIPASVDLSTFNPYAEDLSDAGTDADAVEAVAAATVAAANLLEAVLATAETQGGDDGALNKEEQLEVATQAVANINNLLTGLNEAGVTGGDLGTNQSEQIASLTQMATVVATADVLDGDQAVGDGQKSLADALVEQIVAEVDAAVDGGASAADVASGIAAEIDDAVATVLADNTVVTAGAGGNAADIQEFMDEVEAVADATADANETAADAIATAVENAVNNAGTSGEETPTLANDTTFQDELDKAEDDVTDAILEVVNEQLTESALEADEDFALENQTTLSKGNVFENDQLIVIDGESESLTDLSSETTVFAVNGTEMGSQTATGSASLFLSTADWGTATPTVSASVIEAAVGLANDQLPVSTSNAFWNNPNYWWSNAEIDDATAGSVAHLTVNAAAGDTFSFDYTFSAYEYVPYTDYSFVSVVGTAGDAVGVSEVIRGNGDDASGTHDVKDLKGETFYSNAGVLTSEDGTFTYTFSETGTYTIGIGITDVVDTIFDSMIEVNNITHTAGGAGTEFALADFTTLGNVTADVVASEETSAVIATGDYGNLIMTANGDYAYQMGGANADDLPVGELQTDNFTYTIEQADGSFATSQLTFNVFDVDLAASVNGSSGAVSEANVTETVISGSFNDGSSVDGLNIAGLEAVVITVDDSDVETAAVTQTVNIVDGGYSGTFNLAGLDDGDLTVTVEAAYTLSGDVANFEGSDGSVENHALELSSTAIKDTADLDVGDDFDVTVQEGQTSVSDQTITLNVAGMDAGRSAVITLSNGDGTTVTLDAVSANGTVEADISSFGIGEAISVSAVLTKTLNGASADYDNTAQHIKAAVQNTDTGTTYGSLGEAVTDASAGNTLELAAGDMPDVSAAIIIDKALTINGAHAGTSAKPATNADLDPENPRGDGEVASDIGISLMIAAADVTIDGVTLSGDTPLMWDESLLTDNAGALDGFALKNSVMTGYNSAGAPTFQANDAGNHVLGHYTGATVADNWEFSGNLLGGMSQTEVGDNAGALYLEGVSNLDISDNMFWRPTAGHMYLSSVEDATIDGNSFYHGVHAGGIDLDGNGVDGVNGYGYGVDNGYGFSAQESPDDFYGRNFWVEIKGENTNVTISGNEGQYNSGGIQIYGLNDGFSMDGLTISGNTFSDFVNADPQNNLGDGKTGLLGAINVQIADDTSANDIVISGNTIDMALDQISSDGNELNLISVTGTNITDGDDADTGSVTITGNTVTWSETSSSEIVALGLPSGVTLQSAVAGIKIDGEPSDTVTVTGNVITAEGDQQAIGVYVASGGDEGEAFISTDLSIDNTYNSLPNSEILFEGFSLQPDLGAIDLAGTTAQIVLDIGEDDVADIANGSLNIFGDTDQAVTGNAGNNFVYLGEGTNTADISQGGFDVILVDGAGAATDTTITGFSTGAVSSDGNGDLVAIFNAGDASLDNVGGAEDPQVLASNVEGAAIDDDANVLAFSNELDFGADASQAISDAVDGLLGADDEETFFVLASDGSETVLARVDVGSTGASSTELASFVGVSATDLAGNLATDFASDLSSVAEV